MFSGIFVVNYSLMISAETVFHGTGPVMLTFQDAMLLMDQVPIFLFIYAIIHVEFH